MARRRKKGVRIATIGENVSRKMVVCVGSSDTVSRAVRTEKKGGLEEFIVYNEEM